MLSEMGDGALHGSLRVGYSIRSANCCAARAASERTHAGPPALKNPSHETSRMRRVMALGTPWSGKRARNPMRSLADFARRLARGWEGGKGGGSAPRFLAVREWWMKLLDADANEVKRWVLGAKCEGGV